jgi:hypothetical protein
MTLDCENFDTCISSLTNIVKLPSNTIVKTLCDIDLDKIYSSRTVFDDPDTYLLKFFKEKFNVTTDFTSSFWFHNTRVKKGTDFKKGILPLNLILKEITTFIDLLAESIEPLETETQITNTSNSDYHFVTKTIDKIHWGPYAYFVRQTAIKTPDIFHNYLKIPEIVEDYIGCKYQNIRSQLESKYSENTVSCIVKFKVDKNQEFLIGKALYYLYLTLQGEELNINSNTCFDNNAEIIEADCIHKIEYFIS